MGDAGIGDDDVDPPVPRLDIGDERVGPRRRADVIEMEFRRAAGAGDGRDRRAAFLSRISVTTTWSPSAPKAFAVAAPMPMPAPVTMTMRFLSAVMGVSEFKA